MIAMVKTQIAEITMQREDKMTTEETEYMTKEEKAKAIKKILEAEEEAIDEGEIEDDAEGLDEIGDTIR